MYILKKTSKTTVLLVGAGLVGESIIDALVNTGYYILENKKVDWKLDNDRLVDGFINIIKHYEKEELTIIWSAGKCGFNATEDEIELEQKTYLSVLKSISNQLKSTIPKVKFVLISSIGGLFEGQVNICDSSTPNPLRPYGLLKLYQENLLLSYHETFDTYILRLSSVYGIVNKNKRLGLIQVMIDNGLNHKTTKIYGSMDTLRDYVFVEDVAKFTSVLISENGIKERIFNLASGKPSSINEIKKSIERKIRHKLFLSYMINKTNDLCITCDVNSYNGYWTSTSINENLNKIYDSVIAK